MKRNSCTSWAILLTVLIALGAVADEADQDPPSQRDTRPGIAPDIRDDETDLKVQRGNFVVVPIPIADPTIGDGLVGGAAYFYPQSAEEAEVEPASVTALGGLYTNNDSRAVALAQQNYWRGKWRFTGALAAADLRLTLLTADGTENGQDVDWRIYGALGFAKLARKLKGDWYGGLQLRVIDATQSLVITDSPPKFDTSSSITSAGLGAYVEYDTRDLPMNSYSGRHLVVNALLNDEALGSNSTYQSYGAAYRSYHKLADPLVLAWEMQGCARAGTAPLWDSCTIKLRGFSATDYLGQTSVSGQAELRWQLSNRWGVVGFGGAGHVGGSFNEIRERELIPSYGAGVRFSVLPEKRINLRIDYARSSNSDAIHVSVGEAF